MSNPIPVSPADVEAFQRDGVVCIRGALDSDWVERTRRAMDRIIAAPTQFGKLLNAPETAGRFERDLFMWTVDPDFRALALESRLAEIAARLMRSSRVNLLLDMMLTKEPYTPAPSPWHHDQPYNWVDGTQVCGVWVSLDHATGDSGAPEWLRGSHRWRRWFQSKPFEGGSYSVDDGLEQLPDIEGNRKDYDIACFETAPGDAIFNHLLTVHAAPGNATDRRRRAVIYRFAGDDATYAERGPGRPKPSRDPGLKPGDPFPADHDQFPQVWPKRAAAW